MATGAAGSESSCWSFHRRRQRLSSSATVRLNVGGRLFEEPREVFKRFQSPILDKVLADRPEEDGSYFLDRDGQLFSQVLDFVRLGPEEFAIPEGEDEFARLLFEAKVLRVVELIRHLRPEDAPQLEPPSGEAEEVGGGEGAEASDAQAQADGGGPKEYRGAPLPTNEADRMARLRSLNILETQAEHAYDAITRIVAALLDVPICLISLVAEDHQWFKSRQGLEADRTSRNTSFCSFLFVPEGPKRASMMVVEDALCDARFAENPLVIGEPHIRFYAGSPIVTSDGFRLGALCTIDRVPRALNPQMSQILVNFGQLAAQAIQTQELRNAPSDTDGLEFGGGLYNDDFAAGQLRESRMKEAVNEVVVLVWAQLHTLDWPILYANQAWVDMTGVRITPPVRFPGRPVIEEVVPLPPAQNETGSLWDYLWLQSDGVEEVMNLWKHLHGDLFAPHGMAQPFAKSAVLAPRLVNGNSTCRVSCRFMPAELPLDVAASAIRPASQYAAGSTSRVSPAGYGRGHLYFVTITRLSFTFSMELSRGKGKLPQAIPEGDEEDESEVGDVDRPQDTGPQDTGPSPHHDISARSDSEASVVTKPPTSPYPDVRLLRVLENGSFGKLYFGTWAGACVGVKVLTSEKVTDDWNNLDSIFCTSISHANVSQQYFFDVQSDEVMHENHLWMVREWCDGGSLGTYCKEPRVEGKGLWEFTQISMEIASGLHYMLGRNIVHGALIPSNVLLKSQSSRKGYVCKVSDFGFTRLRQRPRLRLSGFASSTSTLSGSQAAEGQHPYEGIAPHMPPEEIMAERERQEPQPSAKGDIFALGMIMYQVAAGERPSSWLPRGDLPADFASATNRGRWLRLPAKVPGEIGIIYMRCIAANPAERLTASDVMEQMAILGPKFDPDAPEQVQESYRRVGTAPPSSSRRLKTGLSRDLFSSNPLHRRSYTLPGSDRSQASHDQAQE